MGSPAPPAADAPAIRSQRPNRSIEWDKQENVGDDVSSRMTDGGGQISKPFECLVEWLRLKFKGRDCRK